MNSILKTCTKCNTPKELDEFHKNILSRDGRNPVCKRCRSTDKKRHDAKQEGLRLCKKCQRSLDKSKFAFDGKYYRSYCQECDRSDSHNKRVDLRAHGLKKCTMCEGVKKFSGFNKSKQRADGYYPYCKKCESAISKEKYKKNKHKIDEKNRRNYEKNKVHYQEKHKEWYDSNPGYSRHRAIKRRAIEYTAEGSYTQKEFIELCQKYGNVCLKCGKAKKLTVDHVVPLSKGGSNYIGNIQPLCLRCNKVKGVKSTDYRPG